MRIPLDPFRLISRGERWCVITTGAQKPCTDI
jgi:hypothetical protein